MGFDFRGRYRPAQGATTKSFCDNSSPFLLLFMPDLLPLPTCEEIHACAFSAFCVGTLLREPDLSPFADEEGPGIVRPALRSSFFTFSDGLGWLVL